MKDLIKPMLISNKHSIFITPNEKYKTCNRMYEKVDGVRCLLKFKRDKPNGDFSIDVAYGRNSIFINLTKYLKSIDLKLTVDEWSNKRYEDTLDLTMDFELTANNTEQTTIGGLLNTVDYDEFLSKINVLELLFVLLPIQPHKYKLKQIEFNKFMFAPINVMSLDDKKKPCLKNKGIYYRGTGYKTHTEEFTIFLDGAIEVLNDNLTYKEGHRTTHLKKIKRLLCKKVVVESFNMGNGAHLGLYTTISYTNDETNDKQKATLVGTFEERKKLTNLIKHKPCGDLEVDVYFTDYTSKGNAKNPRVKIKDIRIWK